jgi:hypothetical protein
VLLGAFEMIYKKFGKVLIDNGFESGHAYGKSLEL